jgi:hypothetical protein
MCSDLNGYAPFLILVFFLSPSVLINQNLFTEAQQLHVQIEQLSTKLDSTKAFSNWEKQLESRDLEIKGNLLRYNESVLVVDFNFEIDEIYQELHRLEELGFSPSFRITMLCTKAHHFNPMATALFTAVKKFNLIHSTIR